MSPIIWLILTLLQLYRWVIIGTIIISWLMAFNIVNVSNSYVRQISYALRRLTEPVLMPIRRILPDLGGIDISPIIALIGIMFIEQLVVGYLARII
jgi:YggT family protein